MKVEKTISFCIQLLLVTLALTGCGQRSELPYEIQNNTKEPIEEQTEQPVEESRGEVVTDGTEEDNAAAEKRREEILATREAIITIAGSGSTSFVQKTADNFNNAQDKYWVEVQSKTSSQTLIDLSRKQGADIYFTTSLDYKSLAEKGVFEDLTPYFEQSTEVSMDDLMESVRRVGTVGEEFYYVVPRFLPAVCLVVKDYTDNGVWSVEDYFELAEMYPDGMIDVNIKDPTYVLQLNLAYAIDGFIDWESRTCHFEDEKFVQLLEKLKECSNKNYQNIRGLTLAEQFEQKLLLVKWKSLMWSDNMAEYKAMRDSILEICEIAGFPNEEGIVKYDMSHEEMYAMNAESENKEAAWAFFEYILSEEYQMSLQTKDDGDFLFDAYFPARTDVLETALNAEITEYRDEAIYYKNPFTNEQIYGVGVFTEEDKQFILDIANNCYCDGAMHSSNIRNVIAEEVDYFFKGEKTAEEVAKIIQSRISLYLME